MRENYSSHFSQVKGGINLAADLEPFPSPVSVVRRHGGPTGNINPRVKMKRFGEAVWDETALRPAGGGAPEAAEG